MFRKIILRYKESIWFVPSLFIFGSIVLSFITVTIDTTFQEDFQKFLPAFALTGVTLGRAILTVIATALLTMTTITFSTIMVVLSIYSSQFSPRTLQNFISDKLTQIVLGVFISGFTYSIVSLLFMHEREPETFVFSPFFAIVLSLISIGYFIRFLQYITNSIQINNLVEDLSQEILTTLKRKQNNIKSLKNNEKVLSNVREGIINLHKRNSKQVTAHKYGHIQHIDIEGLIKYAKGKDIIIETTKKVGDYVSQSTPYIIIWNFKKDEKIRESYSKYINIGNYKSTIQDLDFGIQKLEEIALRAISPSINDPNTAMLAIRNIGIILTKICNYCQGRKYFYDQEGNLRLILNERCFEDIIYASFYKILNLSQDHISIIATFIEALILVAESKNRKIAPILKEFVKYAVNGFDRKVLQQPDNRFLNSKLEELYSWLRIEDKDKIFF